MLILSNVRKSIRGSKPRLLFQDLHLRLHQGEVVAITGESGVGKSTLLNLIAGLDRPDAGQIELDGVVMSALDDTAATRLRRAKIGFVFQAFHLLPYLDLAHNVALPMRLNGHTVAESLPQASYWLERVGIPSDRHRDLPATLSGGEMQRVAIARALCHRPALLLADEPTGNLDPASAALVLGVLVAQARDTGTATLLVTHSPLAAAHADRLMRLTETGLAPG